MGREGLLKDRPSMHCLSTSVLGPCEGGQASGDSGEYEGLAVSWSLEVPESHT